MIKKSNYYKYRDFYYTEKDFPHLRKTGKDVEIANLLNQTWDWETFNKMKKSELISANKQFTARANEFIRGYYESSLYKNQILTKNRPAAPAYRNYSGLENALLPEFSENQYAKMTKSELKRLVATSRSRLSNKTISLRYYTRVFLPEISKQGAEYLAQSGILSERKATYLMRTKNFQDVFWKLWSLLEEDNEYRTSKYDSNQIENAIIDEIVDIRGNLSVENTDDNSYYEGIKQKIIDKFRNIYEEKAREDLENGTDTAAMEIKSNFKSGRKG